MIRKVLALLSLGGLLLTASCGQTSDPPPRMIGGDAGGLAPVTMAGQPLDKSLTASAQPLPELEGKAGAAGEAPAAAKPAEEKVAEEPEAADEAEPPADKPEEPAAEPKPAEPQATAEPAQPKEEPAPKPNQGSDELGGVYTGPNMLRDR